VPADQKPTSIRGHIKMTDQFSKLPVHVRRRIGFPPITVFVLWILLVGIFWDQSLPGAKTTIVLGRVLSPATHLEFLVAATITTILAMVSLCPVFPVALDVDERGIRKTKLGKEYFYAWSEIVDVRVTTKGGRGGRGAIRFIRVGETEPPKLVDITPGMFGADAEELAALFREGIARWAKVDGAGA
jgi:hypothetical protein